MERIRKRSRIIQFNVYCEQWRDNFDPNSQENFFFEVKIFADKKTMLRLATTNNLDWRDNDFEAHCLSFNKYDYSNNPEGDLSFQLGIVEFYKGNLTPEIISHEFNHATFAWVRRRQLKGLEKALKLNHKTKNLKCSDPEEAFCYTQGCMVGQFHDFMSREGNR